jgi:hypothetical protein
MNKEFIKYEEALALKELGFDEPCFGLYAPPSKTVFLHHYGLLSAKEQILAPLYQQAVKFIRDKYNLCYAIDPYDDGTYDYTIFNPYITDEEDFEEGPYKTYEEAELECLKKLIEIVKTK